MFSCRIILRNLICNSNNIRIKQIMNPSSSMSTSSSQLKFHLKFLELVGNVKQLQRTGWVLRRVNEPETVAAHMYRMSMMSFLIPEDSKIDRTKCMKLALIHDLAECIVGDISPFCGVSKQEKKQREHKAIIEISSLLNKTSSEEVLTLFDEYENQESQEAQLVKDFDLFDMILQAFEYEKRDDTPNKHDEFFLNTKGKFRNEFVKKLVEELYQQRNEYYQNFTTNVKEKNTSTG